MLHRFVKSATVGRPTATRSLSNLMQFTSTQPQAVQPASPPVLRKAVNIFNATPRCDAETAEEASRMHQPVSQNMVATIFNGVLAPPASGMAALTHGTPQPRALAWVRTMSTAAGGRREAKSPRGAAANAGVRTEGRQMSSAATSKTLPTVRHDPEMEAFRMANGVGPTPPSGC